MATRPRDRLRVLRRVDARAAAIVGGLVAVAMSLMGFTLYRFVAMESLEEADRWMAHATRVTQQLGADASATPELLEALSATFAEVEPAFRARSPRGDLTATRGTWPPAETGFPAETSDRDLGAFRLLRPEKHLTAVVELSSGDSIEIAMPLKHFANETAEVGHGIAVLVLVTGLAAMATAVVATFQAFSPLRRATRLVAQVDARRLGRRLPSRCTGDPVDRHAETLNTVLAGVDEAFSRLRRFGSDVAHELRTPLNRIRNVTEVALLGGDDGELRPALAAVQRSAEDMSGIVQTLLLLAEIDDHRLPLTLESIDVDGWLARTAELYAPLFEEEGLAFSVQSDAGRIEADRGLLDRVLVNLLDNTLRHASDGDRVDLQGARSGDWLILTVDDSGPGIPPDERDRIFDRFARLDRSRGRTGSGLGLALARAVARLQGGDLSVEDSPLGGARFVFRLPLQHQRESKQDARAA